MSHGKVVVEFGGYSERLELEDAADMLNSAQAANLLYDFTKTMEHILQAKKKRSTVRILVPQKATPKPEAKQEEDFREGDRVLLRDTNCVGTVSTVFQHHSGMPAYFVKWDPRPDAPGEGQSYFGTDLMPLKTVRTVVMKPDETA